VSSVALGSTRIALSGRSSREKFSRDIMLVSPALLPSGDTLPSLAEVFYSPPSEGLI